MRELFRAHTEQPDQPLRAMIATAVPDLDTEAAPRYFLLPSWYRWQDGRWINQDNGCPLRLKDARWWWIGEDQLLARLPAPCPHCGADHTELQTIETDAGNWAVSCEVCGAVGPSDWDEARAIALWGGAARRALQPTLEPTRDVTRAAIRETST